MCFWGLCLVVIVERQDFDLKGKNVNIWIWGLKDLQNGVEWICLWMPVLKDIFNSWCFQVPESVPPGSSSIVGNTRPDFSGVPENDGLQGEHGHHEPHVG